MEYGSFNYRKFMNQKKKKKFIKLKRNEQKHFFW